MAIVRISYKCSCMKEEQNFYIRSRKSDEKIGDFMYKVQQKVTDNHRGKNPLCSSPNCEYVKIPVQENKGIGEA